MYSSLEKRNVAEGGEAMKQIKSWIEKNNKIMIVIGILILCILPQLSSSNYIRGVLARIIIYATIASGLNIINGYSGQSCLGIVGFTCIESDTLYKNYTGKIAIGDMIVISNCGSYSLVMKPPFILPNFPVLDISEGKIELIKRGETFDDVFHTFSM